MSCVDRTVAAIEDDLMLTFSKHCTSEAATWRQAEA